MTEPRPGADSGQAAATAFDPAEVDAMVAAIGGERENVVAVLQAIQSRYHHLPEAALRRLAQISRITPADIDGVASFYGRFRRTPAGRHTIQVCVGTACFVKGAENIYNALRLALRIPEGADTDRDGLFTVDRVACLGCCALAPVAQIDDVVYGHLTRQKAATVPEEFLRARGGPADESERPRATQPRDAQHGRGVISLCTCTSCRASGAREVFETLEREAGANHLPVAIRRSGCSGISYRAPVVEVELAGGGSLRYAGVAASDVRDILFRHFRAPSIAGLARRSASRLLDHLIDDRAGESVDRLALDLGGGPDSQFWAPQVRIVTAQGERMDPLDLDDYLASGGFEQLRRCQRGLAPREVIEQIRRSGLRGRGGAGYPTALKWEDVRAAPGDRKYVVCNGDEGDPGAFMDRMTLESFPFRVIEGMAIAAYAVGAKAGLFFVRAEYPLAVSRIRRALEICTARRILADLPLELAVAESAGAFVCGEETALIAALEGRRANPRARPPYPSREGLWAMPTLVNNVETLACVPWILARGPEAFRAVGTPASPGTKTFALAGKIRRGGLIEVPMGISIRAIVEEIGGGIQGDRRFKAVQIGGPSGGCIPEALAHLAIDFESLTEAGAMMGSGGMVVLDDSDCMVDVARYFMSFTQRESCGKCVPCRVGTRRMLELLTRFTTGAAQPGDIERLEELAQAVKEGSLCSLGRTAPNPVLSTLRYFRAEYEAHLAGRCPAGRCKPLVAYTITDDCIGCTRCAQHCPAGAIAMRPYEKHRIDESRCIRCDTCRQVCPSKAVRVVAKAEIGTGPTDA